MNDLCYRTSECIEPPTRHDVDGRTPETAREPTRSINMMVPGGGLVNIIQCWRDQLTLCSAGRIK